MNGDTWFFSSSLQNTNLTARRRSFGSKFLSHARILSRWKKDKVVINMHEPVF